MSAEISSVYQSDSNNKSGSLLFEKIFEFCFVYSLKLQIEWSGIELTGRDSLPLCFTDLRWHSYSKEFAPSEEGSKFFPIRISSKAVGASNRQ